MNQKQGYTAKDVIVYTGCLFAIGLILGYMIYDYKFNQVQPEQSQEHIVTIHALYLKDDINMNCSVLDDVRNTPTDFNENMRWNSAYYPSANNTLPRYYLYILDMDFKWECVSHEYYENACDCTLIERVRK